MNLFEAAVIPSVPLGAIIGGVLCKSFGILATVGGVFAGMIAGGFFGWLYAYLVMFLMAVFCTLWNVVRKRPRLEASEEEMANITRTGIAGIFIGIIGSGVVGFMVVWYDGLIAAGVLAVVTALVSVVKEYA
jgi:hypothetical protein